MPRFEKVQAKDADVQTVQENIARALEPLLASFLAGAVLTDEVVLGTSAVHVPHRLGRKPAGWMLVSPSADARVWGAPFVGLEDRLLSLTASATVTVRLVVF